MTTAKVEPLHSNGAPVFDRSELDVAVEPEAVLQTATAGQPAGSQTVVYEISFGAFRLLPAQRLLLEGNKPVQLGSRALDVLIALVERSGELVSKKELMARVWPRIFVLPANLAVHISALRRALRDGRDGSRFFINVPGRGYLFVAPIEIYGPAKPPHPASRNAPLQYPPVQTDRSITGEAIAELSRRVSHNRPVTVAGAERSKQQQHDRRRRPLRAGPPPRSTTRHSPERLATSH